MTSSSSFRVKVLRLFQFCDEEDRWRAEGEKKLTGEEVLDLVGFSTVFTASR
jgi:hypothetical protein